MWTNWSQVRRRGVHSGAVLGDRTIGAASARDRRRAHRLHRRRRCCSADFRPSPAGRLYAAAAYLIVRLVALHRARPRRPCCAGSGSAPAASRLGLMVSMIQLLPFAVQYHASDLSYRVRLVGRSRCLSRGSITLIAPNANGLCTGGSIGFGALERGRTDRLHRQRRARARDRRAWPSICAAPRRRNVVARRARLFHRHLGRRVAARLGRRLRAAPRVVGAGVRRQPDRSHQIVARRSCSPSSSASASTRSSSVATAATTTSDPTTRRRTSRTTTRRSSKRPIRWPAVIASGWAVLGVAVLAVAIQQARSTDRDTPAPIVPLGHLLLHRLVVPLILVAIAIGCVAVDLLAATRLRTRSPSTCCRR